MSGSSGSGSRDARLPGARTAEGLTPATDAALRTAGLSPTALVAFVRAAIAEDLDGGEDVTSVATIDPADTSVADFVVRRDGVIAGVSVLAAVIECTIPEANVDTFVLDGALVVRGDVIATVRAPTIALLTVERTALNLVGRLSGIATHTRAWVDALAGTPAKVRDTRKTTPGMRDLEKYAVRCGGGVNHRRGLSDAVLIKDNHVLAAGGVGAALDAVYRRFERRIGRSAPAEAGDGEARGHGAGGNAAAAAGAGELQLGAPRLVVQTEIDRLDQLEEALAHGAEQILLDNMSLDDMRTAVHFVRAHAVAGEPRILVEASGGLTLATAAEVANTGVDFIAVGALTHSSPILDIALDFRADR